MPSNQIEQAVYQALREVDLLSKKDDLAKNLSGGQKRRLSVAIAFIGGSKLIYLDVRAQLLTIHHKSGAPGLDWPRANAYANIPPQPNFKAHNHPRPLQTTENHLKNNKTT